MCQLILDGVASCMLYIIGVDPLLCSLQQTPHISGCGCLAIWNSDVRISSRERVLGVFIHVSIHDQHNNA